MRNIYKFAVLDKKFAFDINTNTAFEIDTLTLDVLNLLSDYDKNRIIDILSHRYDRSEVKSVLSELEELRRSRQLFVEENAIEFKNQEVNRLTVRLQVAHDCNFRCRYCYAEHGAYGGNRALMTWENAEKIMNFVGGLVPDHFSGLKIVFFGGEPLLNFDLIKKIVNYSKNRWKALGKELKFSISTNASLLNDIINKYLIAHSFDTLFSIDGPEDIHNRHRVYLDGVGSFNDVMENCLRYGRASNFHCFQVSATYTKDDLDLSKRVFFLKDSGFKSIKVEPVQLSEDNPLAINLSNLPQLEQEIYKLAKLYASSIHNEDLFRLEPFYGFIRMLQKKSLRQKHCTAGRKEFTASCDGDIYPCTRLTGKKKLKIGDISNGLDDQKKKIWEETEWLETRNGCKRCWVRNMCGGGCRAASINFNEDISEPYTIGCEIMKITTKAAIWLYSELGDEKIVKI